MTASDSKARSLTVSDARGLGDRPQRVDGLERCIDAVVASYEGDAEINNLESAALPNKRAVEDAFQHLLPVIYLGFYSPRTLDRRNPRHAIAEHMYAAHVLLVDQIDRALRYDHWTGTVDPVPTEASGEEVVLQLFDALPRLRMTLNEDVRAAYEGDPSASSVEEIVFSYPSLCAITAYRIANVLYRAGVPLIPRIISEYAHSQTGIDINPGAEIGQGFFIDHGTGVVVGQTAILGRNVKLYQGVTLGALSVPRRGCNKKRHPTLEDDVTVYAGATILGGETVIGRGSIIGGNVWLVESVPPGSKLFGRGKSAGDH